MNNNQSDETNLRHRQDLLLRASRITSQNKGLRPNWEFQQDLLQDEEAFRLRQEENRLGNARRSNTYIWVVNSIYWVVGMLEILLALRFALRFFGANPQNEFARMINNFSAPFIAPFSTLFISPTSDGGANIFDVNILIAIIVYALLSYLVVSLVRFIFYNKV
jgi:YggT family protein